MDECWLTFPNLKYSVNSFIICNVAILSGTRKYFIDKMLVRESNVAERAPIVFLDFLEEGSNSFYRDRLNILVKIM